MTKKLYWIDDDCDIDGQNVSSKFRPLLKKAGFECCFIDPTDFGGNGQRLIDLKEEIEQGHVRVFILDWQDGQNDELYGHLREVLVKAETRVILKSIYGPALLAAHGVYQRFPELAAYTYWREDPPQRLLDLLPPIGQASHTGHTESPLFDALLLVNQLPIRLLRLTQSPTERQGAAGALTELWRSDSWTLDSAAETLQVSECPEPQFGLEVQMFQGTNPRPPHDQGPVLESKWAWQLPNSSDWLVWQLRQALPAWTMSKSKPYRSPKDCLASILTLAAQAGLARGRYYQITHVDGLDRPLLELTHCTPDPKKRLPVAAEMDEVEVSHFADYAKRRDPSQEGRKKLVSHTRLMNDFEHSANDDAIWDAVIPEPAQPLDECWLVPVYRQTKDNNTDPALTWVQGVFIFDLGCPGIISERAKKNLAAPILNALADLSAAQRSEALTQKAKRAERLMLLQAKMAQASTVQEAEGILVDSVLEIVLMATDNISTQDVSRSAAFSRYEASTHSLVVGADTEGLMTGFRLALSETLRPFVMVRAALAGLQALQQPSEEGQQQPTPIEYVPNMQALITAHPTLAITEDHWAQVANCTEADRPRCVDWLKRVDSVVSIPILDRNNLLGTLTLRSSLRYEFTKLVVDNLREVATMAQPVLARMRAEASRRDFSTLVTHEMRSILSKTKMHLAASHQPGLNRLLDHGYAYSSLLLRHAGTYEDKGGNSDAQLWRRLNAWGEDLKSIQPEPLEWELLHDPSLVLMYSKLLEQVLLVLLDNAFRYAEATPGNNRITLCVQPERASTPPPSALAAQATKPAMAVISISNPGSFSPQDREQLDYGDMGKKSHVGLMLAKQFCQDEGGRMSIHSEASVVTIRMTWPIHSRAHSSSSTRGELT